VFICMSLFTKHNYRAKKWNYLTLKLSTQREQHNNLSDSLKNLPTLFQKWFEYFHQNKS
jgi:hypothetical protein